MKQLSLTTIKKNWPGIIAILALFLGGTSTYSEFIRVENELHQTENTRMQNAIPEKFALQGYYIDVHWSYNAITTDEGIPNVKYKRDIYQENKYVVASNWPTTNWLEKHYSAPVDGFEPVAIKNIRKVSDVREGKKIDPEIEEPQIE